MNRLHLERMPSLLTLRNSRLLFLNRLACQTMRGVHHMLKCPNCHSKDIGKIGINQYYCWSCFIELSLSKGVISTHQVEEDGTLSSLDDLFDEDDRRYIL